MKKYYIFCALMAYCLASFSQDFERKAYNYDTLTLSESPGCDDQQFDLLQQVYSKLEEGKSKQAVILAKKFYQGEGSCIYMHEAYGWSLFRSGEWLQGVEVLDKAIDLLGGHPDLVLRRAYMSIEMAELGVSQRNIDGNSVYYGKDRALPYDEEQFKKANYEAALADFTYIARNYDDRNEELQIIAYIHQQNGDHLKAIEVLHELLNVDDYKDNAMVHIADNYIAMGQYNLAEVILLDLEKKLPGQPIIQKSLYKVYMALGEHEKMALCEKKFYYHQWVPSFLEWPFTEKNYELVEFFVADNPVKEKEMMLAAIVKEKDREVARNLCLTILMVHANHGNGIEKKASEALVKMGKEVVPDVIALFKTPDISTCTMGNTAQILAEIKDSRGWQPLVDFLPVMANMPFTMIPPNVPEQLIRFDSKKGASALLVFIQKSMREDVADSSTPGFSTYMFYYPLKKIKKKNLEKMARDLDFTGEEIADLMDKVYKD
ncbi:MAG: tetratricopeptide repeat protein [Cytophagaceae bacterium]